jgi:hypothetical protein
MVVTGTNPAAIETARADARHELLVIRADGGEIAA